MEGPNIRRCYPRPWYARVEDKLITEHQRHMEQFTISGDQSKALATQISNMCGHNLSRSRNLLTECGTHGRQHHGQAHAHRRVNRFKLNIPEFQGDLQPEEFMDQVVAVGEVLDFKECLKIDGFLWSQPN
jgi:hypothetical protein